MKPHVLIGAIVLLGRCMAAPQPDGLCAGCHKVEAATHAKTAMASALVPAAECDILRRHPDLSFSDGVYSYRIVRQGDTSVYRVTDGKETITVPIAWAFGLGAAGQTYVFERNGRWVESRVSYFRSIDKLDFTLGAAGVRPVNLEEASGRVMSPKDTLECFQCHATGVTAGMTSMIAGIHCERCHEDSRKHAAAVQAGRSSPAETPKVTGMSTEEMSTFCGQCHRTWAQIAVDGPLGIGNIRFQPYRLTNSKCYDAADRRIRCTACHDPHGTMAVDGAAYDGKCQACHAVAPAKKCPVAKRDCSSCHMPKLELPGSHHRFTDHQIRIVRANEKYPN